MMRSVMRILPIFSICLLFLVAPLNAAIDAYPFPNDELRQRHAALIDELRCPQCLNTNLAGSDSMIAKDLRREVHRMLLEGLSDDEILDFMHQRYGDFILYKPRLKRGTLVLWFGPFILGLLVLFFGLRFIRSRKTEVAVLSDADAKRLELLIGKNSNREEKLIGNRK
ncbi:MAG: cytochrome c-type biogenesis protein [Pseudomonadales bacterium]